jgi:hypothetical protein
LRLRSLPADSGTALDVAGNDRGRHRAGRRRPRRPQNCRRTHRDAARPAGANRSRALARTGCCAARTTPSISLAAHQG